MSLRGIDLFEEFAEIIQEHVSNTDVRVLIYSDLIDLFESRGTDSLEEFYQSGLDEAFDTAYEENHPHSEDDFYENEDD